MVFVVTIVAVIIQSFGRGKRKRWLKLLGNCDLSPCRASCDWVGDSRCLLKLMSARSTPYYCPVVLV